MAPDDIVANAPIVFDQVQFGPSGPALSFGGGVVTFNTPGAYKVTYGVTAQQGPQFSAVHLEVTAAIGGVPIPASRAEVDVQVGLGGASEFVGASFIFVAAAADVLSIGNLGPDNLVLSGNQGERAFLVVEQIL